MRGCTVADRGHDRSEGDRLSVVRDVDDLVDGRRVLTLDDFSVLRVRGWKSSWGWISVDFLLGIVDVLLFGKYVLLRKVTYSKKTKRIRTPTSTNVRAKHPHPLLWPNIFVISPKTMRAATPRTIAATRSAR